MHQTTYSAFEDELKYTVSASKCEEINGTLSIRYEVDHRLKLITTDQNQENIQVVEGGRSTISRISFPIILYDFPFLYFNISTLPKHGEVCKYTHQFHEEKIAMFTLSNLNSGEVQYCHDDSESQTDEFQVLIYTKNELDFQYVATLKVDIKLKNDNEPFMVTNKPLLVVRGATKIITKDILTYSDIDLDTNSNQFIIYKNVAASNGWIYLNDRKANEFSQEQVDLNHITFKHNGKLYDVGNITFIVSDGFYEVSGFVKTEASHPFISLKEKDVLMQEDTSFVLSDEVIDLHINFDVNPDDIKYEVSKIFMLMLNLYVRKT